MITAPLTAEHIHRSVMAVPPLARNADFSVSKAENAKIIRHLEEGGVTLLLYGGNANFYHIVLSEFESVLAMLAGTAGDKSLVIPSVGPAFGLMMDQAKILKRFQFPTVMVLPQQGITTSAGVATGVRRFAEAAGVPALLYIKHDGFIEPEDVAAIDRDGVISAIKYATVRQDTSRDPYLRKLASVVDPKKIISGIGEQPAIIHMRDYSLGGYTSGCVCVAPRLSMAMLEAIKAGNFDEAERIRQIFKPLEDIRNAVNPIRVLHEAVAGAGIAQTGPLLPLLTTVDAKDKPSIAAAAKKLLEQNQPEAARR